MEIQPANTRASERTLPTNPLEGRLRRLKLEEKRSQDRITQTTIRQLALQIIRDQLEADRENLETLARLKGIADSLTHLDDLRPALYSALVAEDKEHALAIFLAWHRRNPAEAFDELAKRPDWLSQFCGDPVLLYELETRDIVTQLNHPGRSDHFRERMTDHLASHLASQDDLSGLASAWDSLDEHLGSNLLSQFVSGWVPHHGKQAAEFILHEMSADLRSNLLGFLLEGFPNPRCAWTDDFSTALLAQSLGEHENLRQEIEHEADRIDNTLGDSFYFPRGDASARFEPRERCDDNFRSMIRGVEAHLLHRMDYPQLFEIGMKDLDQIREAMIEDMPAAGDFGELLDAALVQRLLRHDPSQVMNWASGRIPPETLARLCATALRDDRNSRAEQALQVLEAIPASLADHSPELAEERAKLQNQLNEWRIWAPEEGGGE